MTDYFTSDWHIGHGLVAGHRGYGIEAHDAAIFIKARTVLGPTDKLWMLGDATASDRNVGRMLDLVKMLPCEVHLISGNHDPCHSMHRDAHKHQRRYLEAFASVQPFARRRINGQPVLLSHFPYSADRGKVRYSQYRLRDEGLWLLHGHTHSKERWTSNHEIHVGVDAWGMEPVSIDTIAKMMIKGEGNDCQTG